MDKFKKPYNSSRSRGPSRPSFGSSAPRPKFGYSGGDFQNKPPVKKYDAICSTCGKRCEVPFRPESGRPVYCVECFGAPHDAHAGNARKFPSYAPSAGGGKSVADLERQIGAMNIKIDTMLRILETMQQAHPVTAASVTSSSFAPALKPIESKSAFPVPANVTDPKKFTKKASPVKRFVKKTGFTKRK